MRWDNFEERVNKRERGWWKKYARGSQEKFLFYNAQQDDRFGYKLQYTWSYQKTSLVLVSRIQGQFLSCLNYSCRCNLPSSGNITNRKWDTQWGMHRFPNVPSYPSSISLVLSFWEAADVKFIQNLLPPSRQPLWGALYWTMERYRLSQKYSSLKLQQSFLLKSLTASCYEVKYATASKITLRNNTLRRPRMDMCLWVCVCYFAVSKNANQPWVRTKTGRERDRLMLNPFQFTVLAVTALWVHY